MGSVSTQLVSAPAVCARSTASNASWVLRDPGRRSSAMSMSASPPSMWVASRTVSVPSLPAAGETIPASASRPTAACAWAAHRRRARRSLQQRGGIRIGVALDLRQQGGGDLLRHLGQLQRHEHRRGDLLELGGVVGQILVGEERGECGDHLIAQKRVVVGHDGVLWRHGRMLGRRVPDVRSASRSMRRIPAALHSRDGAGLRNREVGRTRRSSGPSRSCRRRSVQRPTADRIGVDDHGRAGYDRSPFSTVSYPMASAFAFSLA